MSNQEFCLFKVDKKRVIWEVTKYCNYKCKHCCASADLVDTKDELTTIQSKNILKQLKHFGVEEIYFSGGEPFSRDDILNLIWGNDYFGNDRVVDDLVRRLRKKMPRLKIHTIYGYGYRLS